MSPPSSESTAAATAARRELTRIARARGDDIQRTLTRYAIERLLYRISKFPHRNGFILKGAMLFSLWAELPYRTTGDLDLLAFGDPSPEQVTSIFRAIALQPVEEDGVEFLPDTIRVETTRPEDEYAGASIRMTAMFAGARLTVLIDLGYGDAVTPDAQEIEYPSLLDAPRPVLRAYPPETVVAEKFQALVGLGMINSRLKDFFDLWAIADTFKFDGTLLATAIRATFDRRDTEVPVMPPVALTAAFSDDPEKQQLWRAFLGRAGISTAPDLLGEVIVALARFLMPVAAAAAADGAQFEQNWQPGGPWQAN
jgi:hypothetical protein